MATLNIKDFPEELHKQVKIRAIEKGITLREAIIEAIEDYLKKK